MWVLKMVRRSVFTIDLAKLKGDGDFTCPLCKVTISPDDESGTTYEIVALTMRDNGLLKTTSIICRRCGTIIHLQGFQKLNEKYHTSLS
jgi:hypothetical protein